jgi:nitric oxide reductase large subunit
VTAPRLVSFASAIAACCAIALAISFRISDVAFHGAGFATIAAAISFPLVAWGCGRSVNGLLGAFVAGLLARMILVAAGFFASHARSGSALHYAVAFFSVYGVTQLVEVAYVFRSSQARRAGAH